ncbi:TPA: type IIA DNA topoisomerase subunit B [Burkholderia vietnamiensis]|nr:type IIA DNA topoisomerase subunit B [Burkholderia vietnamiensis]
MATLDDQKVYDESDFDVLEGLEPVRKVPGMYTRTVNPLHITQEVLDNAIDEAQNGHATKVALTVHADGSISVTDNGRGIPVGIHPKQGVPVVVLAFTRLHAGAKFRKGNSYARSGGLHGVGVSVTNALSTRLEAVVRRDGAKFRVTFAGGDQHISPVERVSDWSGETGTCVRFTPDAQYFNSVNLPLGELEHLLRSKAMLLPGLKVTYTNEVTGAKQTWCYKEGLQAYLKERLESLEQVGDIFQGDGHLQVTDAEGVVAGDGASWAVAWTTESGKGESYVNLIPTPLGGTHEAGFRAGLFEAMREYCEHHALLPRGVTLQAEDVWNKANFVLSANIVHTQFQGQTKDKLTSREVVRVVSSVVKDPFMQWLLANPESGKKIAELVIKQATARLKSGKVVEKRKSSGVATLPGKLTDCQITDITRNELFLVEGDSAGGGCKTARDRVYQAILPLRGKVLNTWEVDRGELFSNQEVHDISVALGIDPHDFDAPETVLDGLRYGKLIILSDADVDGSHIQTLLLTLCFRHFPQLVLRGHVFIAKPPLFRIDAPSKGKGRPAQTIYCLTEQERDEHVAKLLRDGFRPEQLTVARFKGLGEMNPDQLKDTVLNPDTRLLLKVSVADMKDANRVFTLLMGKGESGARREWLETRGNEADLDV